MCFPIRMDTIYRMFDPPPALTRRPDHNASDRSVRVGDALPIRAPEQVLDALPLHHEPLHPYGSAGPLDLEPWQPLRHFRAAVLPSPAVTSTTRRSVRRIELGVE